MGWELSVASSWEQFGGIARSFAIVLGAKVGLPLLRHGSFGSARIR